MKVSISFKVNFKSSENFEDFEERAIGEAEGLYEFAACALAPLGERASGERK
jgi:hypothetical protein